MSLLLNAATIASILFGMSYASPEERTSAGEPPGGLVEGSVSYLPIVLARGSETSAEGPVYREVEVWWWTHNDGTAVYVPASFYWDALEVVACETGGTWNQYAVGRLGERSWFQLHPIHAWRFERRGWSWAEAFDPGKNTEIAVEIWSERGWQPWGCRP